MGRGAEPPWRRINVFLEEIGACGNETEFMRGLMRGLDGLIGMDLPCVFALISPEGRLVPERTLVASRAWFERFRDRYWNMIPDLSAEQGVNTTVIDWNRHLDAEYAVDFMRPQGIRYSLGVIHVGAGCCGWQGTISMNRSSTSRTFNEREQRVMEILQPHISHFYGLHLRLGLRDSLGARGSPQPAAGSDGARKGELLREARGITGREWQIVGLLLSGLSNEEISVRMGISERTVEAHCVHVYAKLDVRNRRELFLLASELCLMPEKPLTSLHAAQRARPTQGRARA
jgi:DNA-binding CsgD family transcriptional regulator